MLKINVGNLKVGKLNISGSANKEVAITIGKKTEKPKEKKENKVKAKPTRPEQKKEAGEVRVIKREKIVGKTVNITGAGIEVDGKQL